MILNADSPSHDPDALAALIKRAPERFSEARRWFSRINKERAEELLLDKIVENLSRNLSDGILQLTIESMSKTQEYQDAVRSRKREIVLDLRPKILPRFDTYVELVPKVGSIEIASLRYTFRVQTEIEAHGVRFTIVDDHIGDLSIDALIASIDLSIVNGVEVRLGTIRRQMRISNRSIEQSGESSDWQSSSLKQISQPTRAGMKFCIKCGKKIPAHAEFCRLCGAKQHETDT